MKPKIRPDEPRRQPSNLLIRKLAPENKIKSEESEQASLVSWFRKTYKPVRILHIPNGGKRDPITAAKMKVAGVSAGVPDLFIPEWGLWIEMKKSNGTISNISDAQTDWMKYLGLVGYKCYVAYGCEHAKELIVQFKGAHIDSLEN